MHKLYVKKDDIAMHITKTGLLGAGTMGKQIALLCAAHGIQVILWNHKRRPEFKDKFRKLALLQSKLGFVEKNKIDEILSNVSYVDDIEAISSCDLIIETVLEDCSVKAQILKTLTSKITASKIISSNTSTLSITELASFTPAPDQFIGIHFFNPPMSMKLVELVKGEYTSDDTVSSVLAFLTKLGKQPVILPETPGFVVNRLLFPMINEAIFLLAEGISDAKTIDSCMKMGAHHPMGPLELADFIGLDVCLSILETLVAETGDGKYRPAPLLKKYVRAKKLGRKSGVGFYHYRTRGE